ncbi:MAG: lipocalin family protein [Bacteroidales bacterium]|jgi:lipocalin|nr:lipocalin family protein [Bacteroidales bacterium]MDD2424852.1 lipocalin family protein [Bacteroidales bacterium]MDD3989964.1 lipocalin family protein [Bacteroidales bacterium]MDD4638530.1 lipocalin family protein [Bacteroidales bacterium]
MKHYLLFVLSLILSSCSAGYLALDPVGEFETGKYMGKWYEISRLPNDYQQGLEENTQFYSFDDDGNISLVLEGRVIEDKSKIKQGRIRAWIPDSREPGKLKVSYNWPFSFDLWILRVDKDYSYALIGEPSGEALWIISRERGLDSSIVKELKEYAKKLGFPVEYMISSLSE